MKNLSQNMQVFLAHTTLESVRDVQEELGIALHYRKEHAAKARNNTERGARKTNVILALWARERVQYLRPLMKQMRGY